MPKSTRGCSAPLPGAEALLELAAAGLPGAQEVCDGLRAGSGLPAHTARSVCRLMQPAVCPGLADYPLALRLAALGLQLPLLVPGSYALQHLGSGSTSQHRLLIAGSVLVLSQVL